MYFSVYIKRHAYVRDQYAQTVKLKAEIQGATYGKLRTIRAR